MKPRRMVMAIAILTAGMMVGLAAQGNALGIQRPIMDAIIAAMRGPTPVPGWHEKTASLSAEETATAASYFSTEFEAALASAASSIPDSPTPTARTTMWLTVTVAPTPTGVPATGTPPPTITGTVTPTPVPSPTVSPTPLPMGDTTPPTVTMTGGPADGASVGPGAVCFPLWIVDNLSWYTAVQTRMKVDGGQWSGWSPTYQYCPELTAPGRHTVTVEGRDEAGNVSAAATRSVTVTQ